MKIHQTPKFEVTPESCRKETGRTFQEWFDFIESRLGVNPGRKAIGDLLFKELKVDAWWVTTLIIEYEAARQIVEKDGRPKGYNICVTKAITAPPDPVFAFMQKGAWAGADTQMTVVKANPPKLLRFTLDGPGHVAGELIEAKITPAGAKCSVVITYDRLQDRGRADGLREAWGELLNTWKTQLES